MKMYIWVDPYSVHYGCSLVVACADSEEEAREVLRTSKSFIYGFSETSCTNAAFYADLIKDKPPSRVLECPSAEWHECSE